MRDQVRDYYGDVLQSSGDLKSDACCEISTPEPHILEALTHIHPEVASKYYGCGLIAPEGLAGKRILDLGCGAGVAAPAVGHWTPQRLRSKLAWERLAT